MKTEKKWDLIGFGAIAVDDLIFVHSFPPPNTKTEVIKRTRQGGGLAGTALVAASRLGAKSAFCGILGSDELSAFTLLEFEKDGVSTEFCVRKEEVRPIHSTIIIDQSTCDRTIFYSLDGFQSPPVEHIKSEMVASSSLIFVDTYALDIMPYILRLAHQHEIPVVADVESTLITNTPGALAEIDYLIFNIDLAAEITGSNQPSEILYKLQTPYRNCTVITAGREGCWYLEKGGEPFFMPAFKVTEVDTTGCGDVFHGAFAAALVRGESIQTCVMQAAAAAAMKATQAGGRSGIPNFDTLRHFMASHPDVIPREVT